MTNYSFEPVSLPTPEELGPVEEADHPGSEGPVRAGGVDPASVEAEEEHILEFEGAPSSPLSAQGRSPVSAEVDLQRQIEAATSEAHRRGVEEGRNAEAVRVRTALEAVRAVVDELKEADTLREKEAEDRVAAIAVAVAAHLMEREVRTSPEVVSDLVRRAIAEFPVTDDLTVHMNPGDLALLSRGIGGETSQPQLTSGQRVRWVPDPQIRSGGCLVEGGNQVVDARLSTTLARLFRAMIDG
ncbi:MAG: hypothetical protein HKN72_06915 [Gemmatimonadetes bacterium]|nr:hypothetical protein [Gemmatimonadota bacterium]NNF12933.1 hypothetical protein [Gemmatimonadota bacterium]